MSAQNMLLHAIESFRRVDLPSKHTVWDKEFILGHRGFPKIYAENTLGSFREAILAGAQGVELDVHLSLDKIPVVIHDNTVERTTNGSGPVSLKTAHELSELNAANKWPELPSEKVPSLEDVFMELPRGSIINVELKSDDKFPVNEYIGCVIPLLQHYKDYHQLIVSSFDPELMGALKMQDATFETGIVLSEREIHWQRALLALQDLQPTALHLGRSLLSEDIFKSAYAKGFQIVAWTIDDLTVAQELFHQRVSGIITNDVATCITAI